MVSVRSVPSFSMPTPCAVNRASCAAPYRDASVSISNSPWIWLCPRYPTVANSSDSALSTAGLYPVYAGSATPIAGRNSV